VVDVAVVDVAVVDVADKVYDFCDVLFPGRFQRSTGLQLQIKCANCKVIFLL